MSQARLTEQLKTDSPIHVIVETKGYDPLAEVKSAARARNSFGLSH
jgi:hypothetical protein